MLKERGRTAISVRKQFAATVAPMHVEYVEKSKTFADYVLANETDTEIYLGDLIGKLELENRTR